MNERDLLNILERIARIERSCSRKSFYAGPHDFVVEHGIDYPEIAPDTLVYGQGAPRLCFANAINACVFHPGLRYVEGYALAPNLGDMPFHHGWNLDPQGRVVDITWMGTGVAYRGVEFSVERADECTWEGDASVLTDFRRPQSVLMQPWRGEPEGIVWPHSPRLAALRSGDPAIIELLLDEMEREQSGLSPFPRKKTPTER